MNPTPRANTFTEQHERIVEFGNGLTGDRDYQGGLMNLSRTDDGLLLLDVYRCDPKVVVRPGEFGGDQFDAHLTLTDDQRAAVREHAVREAQRAAARAALMTLAEVGPALRAVFPTAASCEFEIGWVSPPAPLRVLDADDAVVWDATRFTCRECGQEAFVDADEGAYHDSTSAVGVDAAADDDHTPVREHDDGVEAALNRVKDALVAAFELSRAAVRADPVDAADPAGVRYRVRIPHQAGWVSCWNCPPDGDGGNCGTCHGVGQLPGTVANAQRLENDVLCGLCHPEPCTTPGHDVFADEPDEGR
jgi:hypothetical protein